jgi:hypothetical protein
MHPIDFKNVPAHVTTIDVPNTENVIHVVATVAYAEATDTLTLLCEHVSLSVLHPESESEPRIVRVEIRNDEMLSRHALQIASMMLSEFDVHYAELDASASPAEVEEFDFSIDLI